MKLYSTHHPGMVCQRRLNRDPAAPLGAEPEGQSSGGTDMVRRLARRTRPDPPRPRCGHPDLSASQGYWHGPNHQAGTACPLPRQWDSHSRTRQKPLTCTFVCKTLLRADDRSAGQCRSRHGAPPTGSAKPSALPSLTRTWRARPPLDSPPLTSSVSSASCDPPRPPRSTGKRDGAVQSYRQTEACAQVADERTQADTLTLCGCLSSGIQDS
jgi:hypothetical protein